MSEDLVLDDDHLVLHEDRSEQIWCSEKAMKKHKEGEFVDPSAMVSYHRLPQLFLISLSVCPRIYLVSSGLELIFPQLL